MILLCLCTWCAWWYLWHFAWPRHHAPTSWEGGLRRLTHLIPLMVGCSLIFAPAFITPLYPLHLYRIVKTLGLIPLYGGLWFTILSRKYLGDNWSHLVEVKSDQELVTTGPYSIVRHPIYTGLILAMGGTVLTADTWGAVVGYAFFVLAFVIKASHEERMLEERFSASFKCWKWDTRDRIIPFIY